LQFWIESLQFFKSGTSGPILPTYCCSKKFNQISFVLAQLQGITLSGFLKNERAAFHWYSQPRFPLQSLACPSINQPHAAGFPLQSGLG
jgi:hypothetical protein